MVTSWEDITGIGFFIWLLFTGLFYLVLYLAVLNVTDRKTGNRWIKIPVLLVLSLPASFFIAIFNYNPTVLFFLMAGSNYFRVRQMKSIGEQPPPGLPVNRPLAYTASYLYIAAVFALVVWMQHPVEFGGMMKPYWKSWFTEVPH